MSAATLDRPLPDDAQQGAVTDKQFALILLQMTAGAATWAVPAMAVIRATRTLRRHSTARAAVALTTYGVLGHYLRPSQRKLWSRLQEAIDNAGPLHSL